MLQAFISYYPIVLGVDILLAYRVMNRTEMYHANFMLLRNK